MHTDSGYVTIGDLGGLGLSFKSIASAIQQHMAQRSAAKAERSALRAARREEASRRRKMLLGIGAVAVTVMGIAAYVKFRRRR